MSPTFSAAERVVIAEREAAGNQPVRTTDAFAAPEFMDYAVDNQNVALVNGRTSSSGDVTTVTGSLVTSLYSGQIGASVKDAAFSTIAGQTGQWYVLVRKLRSIMSGGCRFRFRAEGTTSTSGVAFGTFNGVGPFVLTQGSGLNSSMHIGVTPDNLIVSVIVNGVFTSLKPIGRVPVAVPHFGGALKTDSVTSYEVRWAIDPIKGRAVVRTPHGDILRFEHDAFRQLDTVYGFAEAVVPTTADHVAEVVGWYCDSTRVIPV